MCFGEPALRRSDQHDGKGSLSSAIIMLIESSDTSSYQRSRAGVCLVLSIHDVINRQRKEISNHSGRCCFRFHPSYRVLLMLLIKEAHTRTHKHKYTHTNTHRERRFWGIIITGTVRVARESLWRCTLNYTFTEQQHQHGQDEAHPIPSHTV